MEEHLRGIFLPIAADTLDDIEEVRIRLENRIRALTRDEPDKDGAVRGPGLSDDHPDVARLLALLDNVQADEHDADLYLRRIFKNHPLYPWAKSARGIGDKQGARLIAAIGDPYIRPEISFDDGTVEPARPRRGPDELKAYCGAHVVDGAVPVRRKGTKSNWNTKARMRLFLVADKCVQVGQGGPYRAIYDAEKAHYADAIHKLPCVRCGPSGKPAKIGSPLNKGHIHARAVHKIMQQICIDLYRESKRIYEERGWLEMAA